MKIRLFFLLFMACYVPASAQMPAYYNGIDLSLNGDNLKNALGTLISNTHSNQLPYTSSSLQDTWDAIKVSDLRDGDTANVFLVYGYNDVDVITKNDRTRNKSLSCHTNSCAGLWNREHVFPRSLANPSMDTQFPGTGTDAHNLRAADGQMNGSRGNKLFDIGVGDGAIQTNGNFYPGDEWRGDVARIIMYMYVRYGSECQAANVGAGSTSYSTLGDMPNVFLDWNASDPPTQYEKNRNSVFQSMQGNRNPFIDNPYLATKIWNGPQALNTWQGVSTDDFILDQVKVYPSITSTIVHIDDPKNVIKDIHVLNLMGQELIVPTESNSIDVSTLSNGIYLLRLSSKQGNMTSKTIVVRD